MAHLAAIRAAHPHRRLDLLYWVRCHRFEAKGAITIPETIDRFPHNGDLRCNFVRLRGKA